jgi:outer membrane protein W
MLKKIEPAWAMRKLEKTANLSEFNGGYSPPTPHSLPCELNVKFHLVAFPKSVRPYHRIGLLYAKNAKEAT